MDSALAALPTPEDFGDVIRDAIERCWAVAQKNVRGQVDAEIRALKERTEQAERETGVLYIDLTRTLNELESCKLKVAELQHSATGATRMIAARDADTVLPIVDRSTATSNEAPTESEINPAAFDEHAPVVEERAYQPHIDSAAIDKHPMTDSPLGAPRPFDETGAVPVEAALEETAQTPAPEPDLTVEPAERFNEFAPQVLLPELDSVEGLAEELALAETRALAAEARVQDLEAQLANAAQSANPPANDSTGVQAAQEAAQRIAEMEATFAQERQTLQTRLDEANLESTQWKQRAGQLRIEFAPLKEHAAWLSAQSVGRSALCSRLIVELARVSPGNLLLRKEVQQQIVDQAAQNHTG